MPPFAYQDAKPAKLGNISAEIARFWIFEYVMINKIG